MPHIIGISGKTASGKSTLSQALSKELQATLLSWDDFDPVSIDPEDYVEWKKRGSHYEEFSRKALASTLKELKQEKNVTHPALGYVLKSTEYIVFDAPLGRLHKETGMYIDTLIHIEVPLDILLCRRILRDFITKETTKEELLEEINLYLYHARPLFIDDELKKGADIIIDGLIATEESVSFLKKELGIRKERPM